MTGTVRRYGRYVTGPEFDIGYINGYQRACVYDAHSGTVIVYALGGWLGEWAGGAPYCRIFMGDGGSSPGALRAYTQEFQPAAVYNDIAGGAAYVYNVTPFQHGPTTFSLGITSRSGAVAHSMRQAQYISVGNENFYDKVASSTTPTNPIGGTGSNEGQMSLWFVAEDNVAPSAPSGLAVTNSLTPTFFATFEDLNKVLNNGVAYDYATEAHIELFEGATERWDYTWVPATNTHLHSRAYSGSHALQYETTYTYKIRFKDRAGLWGPQSSYSFVITPTNTQPNTPGGLSPSGTVTGTDMTPLMTSTFSDAQEILHNGQAWDYLNTYEIKVTRVNDGVVMWAPAAFTATTTERTNRASSKEYAGTALAYGVPYRYEIRHKDRGGLWSGWASTTFTMASLAVVGAPTNPWGWEANATNPGNITAVYNHASGLSTNAIEARLLSSTGSVVDTSPTVAKTVAPGAVALMTWVEAGFPTLAFGTTYGIQMRARDTNNVWSAEWSPVTTFRVNAPPLTPSGLTPTANASTSEYPLLQATVSDPDPENPTSSLSAFARIKDAAGTVLQTRTMTYNATTGKFEYQTIAADLPSYATYKWDAYSYDGTYYSGGAAVSSQATKSAESTFVYAAGPVVTITAPGSTVATLTPAVTWTATYTNASQQKRRIQLVNPDTGAVVYDTGHITSTSTSWSIQSVTNWIGGERWNNGETFDLILTLTDTNGLEGSDTQTVTLTYPAVAQVAFSAVGTALPGTHGTNAVLLDLTQTSYSPSVFVSYDIYREELIGQTDSVRPGTRVFLKEETNPGRTTFLDADVTSWQRYRYQIVQRITSGNDILASDFSSQVVMVHWDGTIIHMPYAPLDRCVELRFGTLGGSYSPQIALGQSQRLDTPIGVGGRVAHFGPGLTMDPSGDYGITGDDLKTAQDRLSDLLDVYNAQRGGYDGRPHILCWRDGRGGPFGRIYGIISGEPTITFEMGGVFTLALSFALVSHRLGEDSVRG